ncbi:hypothetical protein GOV05_05190 [Candidatus Woesearchaeota archaeon]|nr:hypothetical protein [Candidatus Woesearchaeota archaeon]
MNGAKEYFYTELFYRDGGISPFLNHVAEYLRGERRIPVSKTVNAFDVDKEISFTFTDVLLERFANDPKPMSKIYEAALKYGFRGYSTGEKNGVFLLRKQDSGLIKAMPKLKERHEEEIIQDLDIEGEGLDALRDVKIVWHNPNGERVVGAYNTENDRMIFLDFAHY